MSEKQIKERPILFSGPMVRAILEGRKTQTRRMVKPQPVWVGEPSVPFRTADADPKGIIRCPYGGIDDQLWVRETWAHEFQSGGTYFYRATDGDGDGEFVDKDGNPERGTKWKPSIHMPRRASRITLEITGIRVERLQEITEEDARCEGVEPMHLDDLGQTWKTFKRGFQSIWDSIYGNWDANPYVWVVQFRRVEK